MSFEIWHKQHSPMNLTVCTLLLAEQVVRAHERDLWDLLGSIPKLSSLRVPKPGHASPGLVEWIGALEETLDSGAEKIRQELADVIRIHTDLDMAIQIATKELRRRADELLLAVRNMMRDHKDDPRLDALALDFAEVYDRCGSHHDLPGGAGDVLTYESHYSPEEATALREIAMWRKMKPWQAPWPRDAVRALLKADLANEGRAEFRAEFPTLAHRV